MLRDLLPKLSTAPGKQKWHGRSPQQPLLRYTTRYTTQTPPNKFNSKHSATCAHAIDLVTLRRGGCSSTPVLADQ